MAKGDICIIGMGRFGHSVLETLSQRGKNVVVIDEDRATITKFGGAAAHAACLDSTNEDSLREIGVDKMETVIVAVGSDIEASIITVAILQDMGVPNIIAKATSSRHEQVLKKIGIKNIIRPELDAGRKAAERAIYGFTFDSTAINDNTSMIRLLVSSDTLVGKPLMSLDLRKKYGFSLVSIKREEDVIIPDGNDELQLDDEVIIITKNVNIPKVEKAFGIKKG